MYKKVEEPDEEILITSSEDDMPYAYTIGNRIAEFIGGCVWWIIALAIINAIINLLTK